MSRQPNADRTSEDGAFGRADESPRLQRIEQAVDTLSREMERVSEAQRYSAMRLNERLPDKLAIDRASSPNPVRAEARVRTPH